jgi:adenylosuccinate lyase
MPHKRNPIGCEQVGGLARLVRANAIAALENVALWHERDISHSSVERVILPDSFIALDHMVRRFTRIVTGLVVYPERMRENLERSRGVVFSGTVLLNWRAAGFARTGLRMGTANAMRSFESVDFRVCRCRYQSGARAEGRSQAGSTSEQLQQVGLPGGLEAGDARGFVT